MRDLVTLYSNFIYFANFYLRSLGVLIRALITPNPGALRIRDYHPRMKVPEMPYRPPCSRSERSEASVAARGAGYPVKRARVISGDNSGCKTIFVVKGDGVRPECGKPC